MSLRDTVNSWLFAALLVLLVLSLAIHSLTYFNYDPRDLSLRLWYGLQLCCAAVFTFNVIISLRHDKKGSRVPLINRSLRSMEKVILVGFGIFLAYAIFNWTFTGHVLLHDAGPELVNGHYAIGSHGSFRTVSKEEFTTAMVYEARMFSGHWMGVYLLTMTIWLSVLKEPADGVKTPIF